MEGFNLDSLGDILSGMSPEDLEGLAGLAEGLFGGGEKSEKAPPFSPFDGIDLEAVSRIMGVMQRLKSQPRDPGCELIAALKPLLSRGRQKRADEAISMLRVISLLPIIGEVMG